MEPRCRGTPMSVTGRVASATLICRHRREVDSSTAWALGSWAGLRSQWCGDTVQLSVVGYTSQPRYGPQDKSSFLLLHSDQDPIHVIGMAGAALRVGEQTFTAHRQLINWPFITSTPHCKSAWIRIQLRGHGIGCFDRIACVKRNPHGRNDP